MNQIALTSSIIALASIWWIEAQSTWTVESFTYEQKKEILSLLTKIPNTSFFSRKTQVHTDEHDAIVNKKTDEGRIRTTRNLREKNTEEREIHLELNYTDLCNWVSYFFTLTIFGQASAQPLISLQTPLEKVIELVTTITQKSNSNLAFNLHIRKSVQDDDLIIMADKQWNVIQDTRSDLEVFNRALELIARQ